MSYCESEGPLALELSCPICLQLFSVPVSLPCGHIYCKACLHTAMEADKEQHCCPECQAEFQGTEALVKNFKMCNIVESYKATAGKSTSGTGLGDASSLTHQSEAPSNQTSPPQSELGGGGEAANSVGAPSTLSQMDELAETAMNEPKSKLASQVTELTLKLQVAEDLLRREEEREVEVKATNSQLREGSATLLEQIVELAVAYSLGLTELIEAELRPGEENARRRVRQAAETTEQLRKARLQAECLLSEKDAAVFNSELQRVQPRFVELMAQPLEDPDEDLESQINPSRVCSGLEQKNAELRAALGVAQRSVRNILNPSEATFDLETAHPNLVLSEDLKTVTYSAVKQPYPPLPQRFSSFLQVLSSQSFYGGEYCWEVELAGSPWIVGVCYSTKLVRSGLASALESSRSSWCLMWFDNLLRAFERGYDVPLKKTTVTSRMEIRLSFKTQRLSFYNISPCSGKTHVYTFKANLTEPVHLAYRMMSGQPKARITLYS